MIFKYLILCLFVVKTKCQQSCDCSPSIQVTDATNGKILPHTTVRYTIQGQSQTGDDGILSISSLGQDITVIVEREPYKAVNQTITLGSCDSPVNIPMNPTSPQGSVVLDCLWVMGVQLML